MKVAVLDTSTLIRFYVPDGPLPEAAEGALEGAWEGDGILLVPELALAEVAQVLLKKERANHLSADEAKGILAEVLGLPLEVVGHAEILSSAASLARRLGLTVYDSIFLALAIERGAPLITADEDLASAFSRAAEEDLETRT